MCIGRLEEEQGTGNKFDEPLIAVETALEPIESSRKLAGGVVITT